MRCERQLFVAVDDRDLRAAGSGRGFRYSVGGAKAQRVLGALAAAEVALSLVLLTGAGLLVRSFVRLSSIDPGFRANGVLTMRVQISPVRYDTPERSSGFYSNLLARIAARVARPPTRPATP